MLNYKNNPYYKLFLSQKKNSYEVGKSNYNMRIAKLNKLKKAIAVTYRQQIIEALHKDLVKPVVETELTEIYQIIGEIRFAKANLHKWMRKHSVKTPMALLGATSYYRYESKGVCLIMSPWNFPFNLTFGPLISAIAAGNCVILKPSEMTPHSTEVMSKIVLDIFDTNEVALVQGELKTSTDLLQLPFNHIFFTGSPNVGKIVMTAAAKHLASITLELGGKSPTVIDETANLNSAAKRIVWGKFTNAGQICVAPDYVLINESVKEVFISHCLKWITQFYSENQKTSHSYGRIVSEKHFNRLKSHLENALKSDTKIEFGGAMDEDIKYIQPTILSQVNIEDSVMQDEIFGPLLPIVTYNDLKEAIDFINSKERPLALYIYSKSKNAIKTIVNNTRSGSTCINNNVVQYSNHNLPFGGVNNSGIGKSHGFYGFKAFSNQRSIVKQNTIGVSELLFPPYNALKLKLAKLTIKWF